MRAFRNLVLVFLVVFAFGLASRAQTSMPANQADSLKDTRSLKPPAGAKVAIIEYEDLQCPHCAMAFPFVHAAANRYKLPLIECDYQIPYHKWSHDAAICAHYLKAKVSPTLSEEYRREVFASQSRIDSRDDLQNFTRAFFVKNKQPMPFVMDPAGQYSKEVDATTAQAHEIGLIWTPSIFVVTADHWIEVKDPTLLDDAIKAAQAEANRKTAAPAVKAKHGA